MYKYIHTFSREFSNLSLRHNTTYHHARVLTFMPNCSTVCWVILVSGVVVARVALEAYMKRCLARGKSTRMRNHTVHYSAFHLSHLFHTAHHDPCVSTVTVALRSCAIFNSVNIPRDLLTSLWFMRKIKLNLYPSLL